MEEKEEEEKEEIETIEEPEAELVDEGQVCLKIKKNKKL